MSTIYALSTAFRKSAIAIIRVSGNSAYSSLEIITKKKVEYFKHASLILTPIYLYDDYLDKALVARFNENESYTGEKLVEYHIHGSLSIIKELLEFLSTLPNHRIAEPGEFTKRALVNNKIDILEAEGINDIINAETSQQRKQAIKELNGSLLTQYLTWQNSIKEILAFYEATIDFAEEDIPENLFLEATNKLQNLYSFMQKEINLSTNIKKLKDGISLAILGIPNVGKSSFINYLTKEDTSIVSEIAGTTRDIVEVVLDIQGFPVKIADTAGIRKTKDKVEAEGVKRAINKTLSCDIKIILLNANDLENSYENIKDFLIPNTDKLSLKNYIIKTNTLILVNKIDSVRNYSNSVDIFMENKNIPYYPISLVDDIGLDKVLKDIVSLLEDLTSVNENPVVMQERHQQIVKLTLNELSLALEVDDIILKSHHLRQSLYHIGKINGKVGAEDILDIIFSNFCIGK